MNVFVLCKNDYPEAVYLDPADAQRVCALKSRPDAGIFYHVRTVPLYEAGGALAGPFALAGDSSFVAADCEFDLVQDPRLNRGEPFLVRNRPEAAR